MFPVLFSIGPVTFYTSTLFTILAFFVSTYVFWRKGREEHYPEDELFDGYLISIFWGVLMSRVGYIALHFAEFGLQPLHWLDVFSYPGFVPIFGIVAAGISLFRYAQKQKWDGFEVLDYWVLALTITMSILWLGNFFAGAEVGTPTKLPWGMTSGNVFDKRHPLQLYGAILYFLLFVYLFWVESRYRTFSWYRARKDSAQTGFVFCVFCIMTGVIGSFLWVFSSAKSFFFGVPVDLILRGSLIVYGCISLFQRSGRMFSFRRSKKYHDQ
jgi:prolipoprotein diacylglyceryltransferase